MVLSFQCLDKKSNVDDSLPGFGGSVRTGRRDRLSTLGLHSVPIILTSSLSILSNNFSSPVVPTN